MCNFLFHGNGFFSDAGIQTEKSLEPQQPLRKDPVRLVCLCLFFFFCYSPSDGSQLLDSDGLFSPAEAAASNGRTALRWRRTRTSGLGAELRVEGMNPQRRAGCFHL